MTVYGGALQTKENENLTKDKIELQHTCIQSDNGLDLFLVFVVIVVMVFFFFS